MTPIGTVFKWIESFFKKKPRNHAGLIANELVAVQPINPPQGNLFYMDYFLPTRPVEIEIPMKPNILVPQNNRINRTPSTTSSTLDEYYSTWCGTTINQECIELDASPLKHFLIKNYKWILDVKSVKITNTYGRELAQGQIYHSPLEIHIVVSSTHYAELLQPEVEKKVRDNLFEELLPLLKCIYEHGRDKYPHIIFYSNQSETILQELKNSVN